jgi:hypothetical protein
MPDEHIITPIGAAPKARKGERRPTAPNPKRSLARDIDGLVFVICALTALGSFALSAYFFYGFTQTDSGFWTLASSFGLCFGVGALAYIPLSFIALAARRSSKMRAGRKDYALSLLLILPWVCVSTIFIGWSALPKIYAILSLCLSLAVFIWAFSRLKSTSKS